MTPSHPLHQSLWKESGPESGDLGLGTIPAILFELWALGQIILRLKIPVCLFVLGRVAVITWGLCEVIAVGPLAHWNSCRLPLPFDLSSCS